MISKKLLLGLAIGLVGFGAVLGTWISMKAKENDLLKTATINQRHAREENEAKGSGFLSKLIIRMSENMRKQDPVRPFEVLNEEQKEEKQHRNVERQEEYERRWQEIEQSGSSRSERLRLKQDLIEERAEMERRE